MSEAAICRCGCSSLKLDRSLNFQVSIVFWKHFVYLNWALICIRVFVIFLLIFDLSWP